jgi:hypothetical protein
MITRADIELCIVIYRLVTNETITFRRQKRETCHGGDLTGQLL